MGKRRAYRNRDVFPARNVNPIPAGLLVLGSQRTKNALIVILYAALVGLIYALPHYWLWRDAGSEWAFPGFNVPDEQGAYAGRIRALYNGERLGADPQSLACPDAPTDFATTGEYLTFGVCRLLGVEIRGCFILSDLLLPAVTLIGFYLFLRALGCSARISRLAPLTLYLLDPFLASKGPFAGILQAFSLLLGRALIPHWNCSFILSRMISPEAAMPLLAFACFSTVKALWGGRWPWSVLAGVLSGLAASAHVSVGVPFLLGLFFFGIGTLVTHKIPFGRFVLMGCFALIVMSPRLLELYRFFHQPGSHWVLDRHATITHGSMGLKYLIPMIVFAMPFLLLARKRHIHFWFFLSILAANLVCMNLQMITGSDFGIVHYLGYNFIPMAWFAAFVGLSHRLSERSADGPSRRPLFRARALELACCLYSLANGYAIQQGHYKAEQLFWVKPTSKWLEFQALGPVLSWLEENATPRDVVISSPETRDLYAIYAPTKVLAQFTIQTCPVPTESYLDRFLLPFKVYGLGWEDFEPVAEEMIYDIHMIAETGKSGPWVKAERPPLMEKQEILLRMKTIYASLPEGESLDRMLRDLNVRYVVFGPFEKELPGASDSHLMRDNYRVRFEGKGTRIFELLPSP